MPKAKENLFSAENNKKDKAMIKILIDKMKERLKNPKDAQKAALIIQQWIHESKDQKEKQEKDKKSA